MTNIDSILKSRGITLLTNGCQSKSYLFYDFKSLKSLLQYHITKASVFCHLAFFMIQLSHLYMTTGKTTALIIWMFVGKVMSLLFNMLSRLIIAFLPRNNHLLILWLQLLSTVILEPKEIKAATVSTFSPSICYEVMGPDAMIFVFEC